MCVNYYVSVCVCVCIILCVCVCVCVVCHCVCVCVCVCRILKNVDLSFRRILFLWRNTPTVRTYITIATYTNIIGMYSSNFAIFFFFFFVELSDQMSDPKISAYNQIHIQLNTSGYQ